MEAIRGYPENIDPDHKSMFDVIMRQTVPPSNLLEFENATLYSDGWVRSNGSVVEECFLPHRKPARKKKFKKKISHLISGISKAKAETGLWISDPWYRNYYHWLVDTIPRLHLARQAGVTARLYLPEQCLSYKYIAESLVPFETEPPVYVKGNDVYQIKKLYLPTYAGTINNNHPPSLREVADVYLDHYGAPSKPTRRIFISRRDAATRSIINEEEILPVLEKHGFEVFSFSGLTFLQQYELMSSCEAVASPHGAGMTNMMLMPQGGKVIEIHADQGFVKTCYFALANALKHRYHYILADRRFDTEKGNDDNLNLDPESLDAKLIDILK